MEVGGTQYRNPSPHIQTFRVPNLSEVDFQSLRTGRLARLQKMMHRHDIPVCLFYNPGNIRYATGTEVMGVWTATPTQGNMTSSWSSTTKMATSSDVFSSTYSKKQQ